MQRPALVRRNANLPPNVSKEAAFCYQTNSRPYHFNMSMGHQYMHRRREIQRQSSSCDYDDDDDDAFNVTDSEAEEEEDDEEDEYETNIHLALDSDNHYGHDSYFNNHSNVDATPLDDVDDDNNNDNDTHNNDNDSNSDSSHVNHHNNDDTTDQETVMTAARPMTSNPIVSVDNSQIDQTFHQNFSGSLSNSNESRETDPKHLTDNLGIHNQSSNRCVSNEETRDNGNEDKFDSPNIGNDLDARRRMPSLSYLLPSDDIIISDENENESENSDTENGDNNTLIICQENDA